MQAFPALLHLQTDSLLLTQFILAPAGLPCPWTDQLDQLVLALIVSLYLTPELRTTTSQPVTLVLTAMNSICNVTF